MNPRIVNALLWIAAIASWLALAGFHVVQVWAANHDMIALSESVTGRSFYLTAAVFVLVHAFLFRRLLSKDEALSIIPMLWRLFIIGLFGLIAIGVFFALNRASQTANLAAELSRIYFSGCIYALVIFFLAAFYTLRRFALYQKTRRKIISWNIMQGVLIVSLILSVWKELDNVLPLSSILSGSFVLLSLFVSSHVSWVAYLTFMQKVKVLGMFLLAILLSITFYVSYVNFWEEFAVPEALMPNAVFISCTAIFVITYCAMAVLVLVFNLPTASLFERKSSEVASFNKINQAIQANLDSSDILNTLLEASLLATNADAGWIETTSTETKSGTMVRLRKKIEPYEITELRQGTDLIAVTRVENCHFLVKDVRRQKPFRDGKTRFRSFIAVPIATKNRFYGVAVVASELSNVFEDVSVQSLTAFAEQAGIALDNAALVKNSIDLERYREQLKIAKEVQQQLLPRKLPESESVQFAAISETAEEVGGDYFDVISVGAPTDGRYRLAIGDISGKGTTAAFYMAELKGVFHALARMELRPDVFLMQANAAIVGCIPKGSFMTLTYVEIDTRKKTFDLVRAGHCPTYYFSAETNTLELLREGTIGLGILRDGSYANRAIPTTSRQYQANDFLVLYTDGILEARNAQEEEFGYERLRDTIWEYRHDSPDTMATAILNAVKTFTDALLDDDHTVLVVKFV